MSDFSEALVRERVKYQKTRDQVADMCGVSKAVVKRWEAGESVPNRGQFKALCNILRRMAHHLPSWPATITADSQELKDIARTWDTVEAKDPTPRPPAVSFGTGLRRVREENEVSQEAIAQILELHPTAIGQWERDETVPVRENFNKILEVLPELRVAINTGAVQPPKSQEKPVPPGQTLNKGERVLVEAEVTFTSDAVLEAVKKGQESLNELSAAYVEAVAKAELAARKYGEASDARARAEKLVESTQAEWRDAVKASETAHDTLIASIQKRVRGS
jgi:transcriptional regulator with XRE-family HTH domain